MQSIEILPEHKVSEPSTLMHQFTKCKQLMVEEYNKKHNIPWIVCFSGGKDSTLLLQIVCEMLLEQQTKPTRKVHVVANDTLVESPLIVSHLDSELKKIETFSKKHKLPMEVIKTTPGINDTFWVNLIGRGYASPNRSFRWCTDRLKIRPTSKYIKEQVAENGEVIVLLGVRSSESRSRKKIAKELEENQITLRPHKTLANCMVFLPIIDMDDEGLWTILLQRRPPWGETHRNLITLYRNAQGGRCPTPLDKSDAPMCGGASARFGCWTCTVIKNDKSLEGLIDSGFEQFQPLVDFRNYLAEIRSMPSSRMKRRRNGTLATKSDGTPVKGPFTVRTRKLLLEKLEELERQSDGENKLISVEEKEMIAKIWEKDEKDYRSSKWRK